MENLFLLVRLIKFKKLVYFKIINFCFFVQEIELLNKNNREME